MSCIFGLKAVMARLKIEPIIYFEPVFVTFTSIALSFGAIAQFVMTQAKVTIGNSVFSRTLMTLSGINKREIFLSNIQHEIIYFD